jgi:hypothetical protein
VKADGTFEITGVPPGDYKLQAAGPQELVVFPIVVNGVDVSNVALTTSAGWSVRGTVVIDSETPAALRRNQVTLAPSPIAGRNGMSMSGQAVTRQVLNDDWSFSVSGVVGAARLRINAPDGWAVKEVLMGGRDVADVPLDLKSGEEVGGLQIVLTDKAATVTGQVLDANNATADGTVLLFPDDVTKWYEGSRFVRVARPDQRGRYRIAGVLPGTYLAVAIDYVEDGIWNDPEFLDSIRRHTQKVTVTDPAAQTLSLKVVTP